MKNIRTKIHIVVVLLVLLSSQIALGQGPPPPPNCPTPPCAPIPIDGGILALLTGAVLYGGKKLIGKNSKK